MSFTRLCSRFSNEFTGEASQSNGSAFPARVTYIGNDKGAIGEHVTACLTPYFLSTASKAADR